MEKKNALHLQILISKMRTRMLLKTYFLTEINLYLMVI